MNNEKVIFYKLLPRNQSQEDHKEISFFFGKFSKNSLLKNILVGERRLFSALLGYKLPQIFRFFLAFLFLSTCPKKKSKDFSLNK